MIEAHGLTKRYGDGTPGCPQSLSPLSIPKPP
jgi:hypothetical protein